MAVCCFLYLYVSPKIKWQAPPQLKTHHGTFKKIVWMLEFSVKPCMEAFIHSFIHSRIHHHGHRRIATVATRTEFNGALWAGLTGPQQMGV